MLNITPKTTIAELQQGPAGLMKVLRSTGFYQDGDDTGVTLDALCLSYGLHPDIIMMMLAPANFVEETPPLDLTPFENMSLPDFVSHIESVYHAGLRTQLPRLRQLTAAAAAAAPGDERLAALQQIVANLADELEVHLLHEEESLFPIIRAQAMGAMIDTRCGSSVGGPVACMENDHDVADSALQKLLALTDNHTAPASAVEMLEALREFDRDLREHMYLENKSLFPRATAAQSAVRRQPATA